MHVTFDLGIREDNVSTVRSNMKQSWKQLVVALVGLAVCIHQFWSVKSSQVLSSPVQIPGFTETHSWYIPVAAAAATNNLGNSHYRN